MRMGSELRTEEGRAEVLLAPGVFMRLGENGAVRLVSEEIMDTRVEFLAGAVIVETADMAKDQTLTFFLNGATLVLLDKGLYRLDAAPPEISVYDGEARVTFGGQTQILKRGRRLRLDGAAVAEKFDTKTGDDLLWWARRRDEYLAVANVSAAMAAQPSGYLGGSSWMWNPFFGAYTYLPMSGFYNDFWGCQFYAPYWGSYPVGVGGGPSRPGNPTKGPIRFHPPKPPGHPGRPPVPRVVGGHLAWGGSTGASRSIGSGYARGIQSSGGGGHSGGGYSGGGGHSGGGGYSGGGHSGGGGYSGGGGGGGGHSSGGGGGGGGASSGGHGR
jgi:hypothetical protein